MTLWPLCHGPLFSLAQGHLLSVLDLAHWGHLQSESFLKFPMNIRGPKGEGDPTPLPGRRPSFASERTCGDRTPRWAASPAKIPMRGMSTATATQVTPVPHSVAYTHTHLHTSSCGFLEEFCEAAGAHVTIPLPRRGSEIVPGFPKAPALLGGKVRTWALTPSPALFRTTESNSCWFLSPTVPEPGGYRPLLTVAPGAVPCCGGSLCPGKEPLSSPEPWAGLRSPVPLIPSPQGSRKGCRSRR